MSEPTQASESENTDSGSIPAQPTDIPAPQPPQVPLPIPGEEEPDDGTETPPPVQ